MITQTAPTGSKRQSFLMHILVLVCTIFIVGGGVLTVVAYSLTQQRVIKQTNLKFEEVTAAHAQALLHHMETYGAMLYAARGLFAATDVQADTWNNFIHAQSAPGRYRGMRAIGYAEVVPAKGIKAYEQKLQSQHKSIRIHPMKKSGDYIVLTYHEEASLPDAQRTEALGFDLASSSARLQALQRARTSDSLAATGHLELITTGKPGFLLVLPLTDKFEAAGQPAAFGYAIAAFDMHELITATIGKRLEQYKSSVYIADITGDQAVPLYAQDFQTGSQTVRRDMNIQVADRTWRVTFETPTANLLMITDRLAPVMVLVAGIGIVVSFCIVAYTFKLRYRYKA